MPKPRLTVVDGSFTIHRFPAGYPLPDNLACSRLWWAGRTDEELSVVCDSGLDLPSERRSEGWSCLKVVGPIDLSVTGLLADITAVLAAAEIAAFALSTFDTDYVLVREERLTDAVAGLRDTGYVVNTP